ncbi:thiamine phosphate synthase [Candidatus Poribacteria bacterium]|nr:thiamine phosphate synthase [Candidatus Poribacteria bacterium]
MIDFNLYVITNRHLCSPKPLDLVISELLDVGITAIQLREKDLDDDALYRLATPISELCNSYKAKLFINTNVKVAVDVGAVGIHLPDNEVSISDIRSPADTGLLVGCSIHGVDNAKKRENEGADFLTYSPIYQTASKPNYGPVVGLTNLETLVKQVKIPVFALGGITPERVRVCLGAGASGVAVMSGIMSPTDAAELVKKYLNALD